MALFGCNRYLAVLDLNLRLPLLRRHAKVAWFLRDGVPAVFLGGGVGARGHLSRPTAMARDSFGTM